jgi:hypothetical protein
VAAVPSVDVDKVAAPLWVLSVIRPSDPIVSVTLGEDRLTAVLPSEHTVEAVATAEFVAQVSARAGVDARLLAARTAGTASTQIARRISRFILG